MVLFLTSTISAVIAFSIFNSFAISSFPLILYYRNEEIIRKRLPIFMLVQTVFIILGVNYYLYLWVEENYYSSPNFITLWIIHFFQISFYGCNLLRDIYIIFLNFLNMIRSEKALSGGSRETSHGNALSYTIENLNFIDKIVIKSAIMLNLLLKKRSLQRARRNSSSFDIKTSLEALQTNVEDGDTETINSYSSFNAKDLIKALGILVLVASIICLAINISFPNVFGIIPTVTSYEKIPKVVWYPLLGISALFLLIKPALLYTQRNISEFGIRTEAFATAFTIFAGLVCYLIFESRIVPRYIYPMSSGIIVLLISNYCPIVWLLLWENRQKKAINEERSRTLELNFRDLLDYTKRKDNQASYEILKKTMVDTLCIENLIFHEHYQTFLHQDQKQMMKDLRKFSELFIQADSPYELNLSYQAKENFLGIPADDLEKKKEALQLVYEEVMKLIYTNSFPKYLKRVSKVRLI
jgi:hypothetical protein